MFGDTGLMMRADATKGDCLLGITDCLTKFGFIECSIVSMIVTHSNAMGLCELFEFPLSFNGLITTSGLVNVDTRNTGGVINEDSCSFVANLGNFARVLSKKSRNC